MTEEEKKPIVRCSIANLRKICIWTLLQMPIYSWYVNMHSIIIIMIIIIIIITGDLRGHWYWFYYESNTTTTKNDANDQPKQMQINKASKNTFAISVCAPFSHRFTSLTLSHTDNRRCCCFFFFFNSTKFRVAAKFVLVFYIESTNSLRSNAIFWLICSETSQLNCHVGHRMRFVFMFFVSFIRLFI